MTIPAMPTAAGILQAGIDHLADRAVTYDKPQGERSVGKVIAMFNELIAEKLKVPLSEEDGWNFMELLKLVRSKQGDYKADSFEDRACYAALAAEAAFAERVALPMIGEGMGGKDRRDPAAITARDLASMGVRTPIGADLRFDQSGRQDAVEQNGNTGEHYPHDDALLATRMREILDAMADIGFGAASNEFIIEQLRRRFSKNPTRVAGRQLVIERLAQIERGSPDMVEPVSVRQRLIMAGVEILAQLERLNGDENLPEGLNWDKAPVDAVALVAGDGHGDTLFVWVPALEGHVCGRVALAFGNQPAGSYQGCELSHPASVWRIVARRPEVQ